uniref:LOW QUALITY PROTEIN: N-acetylmuramoyl-L-alanine amidase n=1 Tax=Jaculus jaculus TaxID=51337 RepID=UPI001E1B0BED|nr:LOW QUALITY PROTEIN: N-acetylmuramoyl-L-alanine amidase [Jaculus jaculus]
MMKAQSVLWILLGSLLCPEPGTASLPLVMDSVIQALASLEKVLVAEDKGTASAWILSAQDSSPRNPLHHYFLFRSASHMAAKPEPQPLSPELQEFVSEVAHHDVRGGQEHGVVLAPDGSTVAVTPLLAGLEAGLQGHRIANQHSDILAALSIAAHTLLGVGATSLPGPRDASPEGTPAVVEATSPDGQAKAPTTVDSLLAVTLAGDLGLTFLQSPKSRSPPGLGSEGCWDQLAAPRAFKLLDSNASRLTVAFLNGALDGAILGDHLSRLPEPRPSLSHLLSQYYGAGVAGNPEFRSNFRRRIGAALISEPMLAQQVWGTLILLQRLQPGHPQLKSMSQEQLAQVATYAAKEFTEAFLGCPAIHPRCRWGAKPYRGQPTPLQLPLGSLFVHHTYEPALPCTTLARCSADMRSMQRFHQDTRGWADIGYSFVVGSDGYLYEGRGWHRLGAHTRGHNSRGFGVAIVGNYMETLPDEAALSTVRDVLPRCAVRAGLLRADYRLQGHRQLVHTTCPGDALFGLLRTWPHFAQTGN